MPFEIVEAAPQSGFVIEEPRAPRTVSESLRNWKAPEEREENPVVPPPRQEPTPRPLIQRTLPGYPETRALAPEQEPTPARITGALSAASAMITETGRTLTDPRFYKEVVGGTARDATAVIAKAGAGVLRGMTLGGVDLESGKLTTPFTDTSVQVLPPLSKALEEVGVSEDIARNQYVSVPGEVMGAVMPWSAISSGISKGINILRAARSGGQELRALSAIERVGIQTATGAGFGAAQARAPEENILDNTLGAAAAGAILSSAFEAGSAIAKMQGWGKANAYNLAKEELSKAFQEGSQAQAKARGVEPFSKTEADYAADTVLKEGIAARGSNPPTPAEFRDLAKRARAARQARPAQAPKEGPQPQEGAAPPEQKLIGQEPPVTTEEIVAAEGAAAAKDAKIAELESVVETTANPEAAAQLAELQKEVQDATTKGQQQPSDIGQHPGDDRVGAPAEAGGGGGAEPGGEVKLPDKEAKAPAGKETPAVERVGQRGGVTPELEPYSVDGSHQYNYIHNTEKAPKPGPEDTFGQLIEPAGKYMNLETPEGAVSGKVYADREGIKNWERGTVTFDNPLVIEAPGLTKEWKTALSEQYGGATGKALSEALIHDGYDAVITMRKGQPSEVVSLKDIKPQVIHDKIVTEFDTHLTEGNVPPELHERVISRAASMKELPRLDIPIRHDNVSEKTVRGKVRELDLTPGSEDRKMLLEYGEYDDAYLDKLIAEDKTLTIRAEYVNGGVGSDGQKYRREIVLYDNATPHDADEEVAHALIDAGYIDEPAGTVTWAQSEAFAKSIADKLDAGASIADVVSEMGSAFGKQEVANVRARQVSEKPGELGKEGKQADLAPGENGLRSEGGTPGSISKTAEGSAVTVPARTYPEGVDSKGNVWIRQSNTESNAGRQLLVQFSTELINKDFPVDASTRYYDALYGGQREGYLRLRDFWEIPQWMGYVSNYLPNADVYVVRDMAEASKFLNEAGYDRIVFSAIDVNKEMIKTLAKGFKGQVDIGGYTVPGTFDDLPNAKWHPTLDSLAKDVGVPFVEGVNYRHFEGSKVIPRLTMSQGCLHKCAFCTVPKDLIETSTAIIDQQAEAFGALDAKLVYLNDKTFGQAKNYTHLENVYQAMLKNNPDFKGFIIQTTGTQLNKMDPEWLKRSGIKYVELGVETYNNAILKKLHKPHNETILDKAAQRLRESDIALIPNIIIGLPGETAETYARTMQFLEKNEDIISHANIYNLALYEGAELAQSLKATTPQDLDENVLEKSFHTDKEIHKGFADKVYAKGQGTLEKKAYSIGETPAMKREIVEIKRTAKKNGTYMKAPNGSPTLLEERLWAVVRTKNFKNWFGDWEKGNIWGRDDVSKVVDLNEEPLVVYHGTEKGGFSVFDPDKRDSHATPSTFFTSDERMASTYAGSRNEIALPVLKTQKDLEEIGWSFEQKDGHVAIYEPEGYLHDEAPTMKKAVAIALDQQENLPTGDERGLYPVFLNIRNPEEMDFEGANWDGQRYEQYSVIDEYGNQTESDGKVIFTREEADKIAEETGGTVEDAPHVWLSTDDVVRDAKRLGNDGAIIRNVTDDGGKSGYYSGEPADVFVIFNPEQAKSATWNVGTFDKKNADARYAIGETDKINDPAPVVEKIKKGDRPESWEKIEQIAKKRGQFRHVTEEQQAVILDALAKAPTVSELAATAWAGRAARWWHSDDNEFFKEQLGDDTFKFFGVMAATSPQAKAETENIRYGVNAWSDYVNLRKDLGREPTSEEIDELVSKMDVGMDSRRGGVARALKGEQLGATEDTLKTRFYQNALAGIEMGAVLDIWHGRGMGQVKFQADKEGIKIGQEFSDSIIYSVLADRMDRAAKVLDAPQSASQAAQWTVIKAIWDKMGDPKRARKWTGLQALQQVTNKDIALAGNYTTGIANYYAAGHPIIEKLVEIGVSREAMAKLKPTWKKLKDRGINPDEKIYSGAPPAIKRELEALALRLEKLRDDTDTLKAQEEHIRRGGVPMQVTIETTHGEFAKLPLTKRQKMHKEIREKVLTDKVINSLGTAFGVNVTGTVDGPGLWFNPETKQFEKNPNFSPLLAVPPGKVKKEMADRIRGFAATLGHALRQEAIGFTHPIEMDPLFEISGGPVLALDLGKTITYNQSEALSTAMADIFPPDTAFLAPTKNGVIITMPKYGKEYPLSYEDFGDKAHKALDISIGKDVKSTKSFEKDVFEGGDYYESRGVYQGNAEEVPSFESAIRNSGGPRGVTRAGKLLAKIDEIKDRYRARGTGAAAAKRTTADGRPEGLAKGKIPGSYAIGLSKKEKDRVKSELAKDPSLGAPAAFKNKTVILTHWSNQPKLTTTDPTKHGTGAAGAERKSKSAYPELWVPKTYTGYGKYISEPGIGAWRYGIEMDGNLLYDAWEDPLRLFPSAEESRKLGYYTGAARGLIHERRIKDAGFKAYVSTHYNVVALFTPEKVFPVENSNKVLPQPTIGPAERYAIGETLKKSPAPVDDALPEIMKVDKPMPQILAAAKKLYESWPDAVIAADGKAFLPHNPQEGSHGSRVWHLIRKDVGSDFDPEKARWLPNVIATVQNASRVIEDDRNGNRIYVRAYRNGSRHMVVVEKDGSLAEQSKLKTQFPKRKFTESDITAQDRMKIVWERKAATPAGTAPDAAASKIAGSQQAVFQERKPLIPAEEEFVKTKNQLAASIGEEGKPVEIPETSDTVEEAASVAGAEKTEEFKQGEIDALYNETAKILGDRRTKKIKKLIRDNTGQGTAGNMIEMTEGKALGYALRKAAAAARAAYAAAKKEGYELVKDARAEGRDAVRFARHVERTEAMGRMDILKEKAQEAKDKAVNDAILKTAAKFIAEAERIKAKVALKKYLDGLVKRISKEVGPSVDFRYKEAIEALQAGIDPKMRQPKTLERREATREYLRRHPDAEIPTKLMKLLDKKPLNEWSVLDLRNLADEIDRLRHLGTLKRKLKLAKAQHEHDKNVEAMTKNILKGNELERKAEPVVGATIEEGKGKRITTAARAMTLQPARIFDKLDAGKNFRGIIHELWYSEVNDAENDVLNAIDARLNATEAEMKSTKISSRDLSKKTKIQGTEYTRDEMMDIYAGWKNEKKKLAMMFGNNITTKIYEDIEKALTTEEKALVDYVINEYQANYDRLRDAYIEFANEDTGAESSYTPMRRMDVTGDPLDAEIADELLLRRGLKKASMEKGFTINRKNIPEEFQKPIRLGLMQTYLSQVPKQERFIRYAQKIRQLNKFLADKTFREAVEQQYGREYVEELEKYVARVSNPNIYKAMDGMALLSQELRHNASIAYLAYNLMTLGNQIPSLFLSLGDAGGYHLVASMMEFAKNPMKMIRMVSEKDPQVRHQRLERELEEIKKNQSGLYQKIREKVGDPGFLGIYWFDRIVRTTAWNAVYQKNLADGLSERDAVRRAGESILRIQEGASPKDISSLYATSEYLNWFLQFTSQLSKIYGNITYEIPAQARQKKYGKAFMSTVGLVLSALGIWVVSNKRLPDTKEEYADALIQQVIDSIPLVGKVISASKRGFGDMTPPVLSGAKAAADAVFAKTSEQRVKKAVEGVAVTAGLPYVAAKRAYAVVAEKNLMELTGPQKSKETKDKTRLLKRIESNLREGDREELKKAIREKKITPEERKKVVENSKLSEVVAKARKMKVGALADEIQGASKKDQRAMRPIFADKLQRAKTLDKEKRKEYLDILRGLVR